MVYAARYGVCEPEHHGTDEFKTIAHRLKSEYGENLTADDVTAEMDRANQSAAGAKLRAIKSERRSEQSRINGKRGGRPAKTQQPTQRGADGADGEESGAK
jgi:hypothetical protein